MTSIPLRITKVEWLSPRMRNWLFMVFGGILYLGPMLAGLAGYGWAVVAPFVAVFMIWQIILRPSIWPQDRAAWRNGALVTSLAARTAIQVWLVVFCFAFGRGIGGVLGTMPLIPVSLSLALSFVAIPLTRLLRPEWVEADDAAEVAQTR